MNVQVVLRTGISSCTRIHSVCQQSNNLKGRSCLSLALLVDTRTSRFGSEADISTEETGLPA